MSASVMASRPAASAAAAAAPAELSQPHASHPLLQAGQQVRVDVDVQGIPTCIIVTSFSDRIFVAVTQLNKLGSFTLAATTHVHSAEVDAAPSYAITTLLGSRQAPLPQLLARRLIESLSLSALPHMASKSLLLSVAMRKPLSGAVPASSDGLGAVIRDDELQAVRDIVAHIDKIKMW